MSYSTRGSRHRRRHVAILAASIGLMSAACAASDESTSSTPVTSPVDTSSGRVALAAPAEFSAFLEDNPEAPLINVHIPYEQHIEGTDAFIPFESILESDDLPTDRSAPIALYCRSGNMSAQASADLTAAGYTNVIDLEGGMNAWDASGNALLDDPTADDA